MADEIRPSFPVSSSPPPESAAIQSIISALDLQTHIEGGYYAETHRDALLVPSPFPETPASELVAQRPGFDPRQRNISTTIFYLVTPSSPQGNFHRNRGVTIHTLHKGRGRYVLIHADEDNRIESFVVGHNVAKGERLQWIVTGGKYKASFLLPDQEGGDTSSEGLLISETVVPGFEFCDHDFLSLKGLHDLLGEEKAKPLEWLVRKD